MGPDLYLGLTTLGAGVFAVFAAALFVLIQTASDAFSLSTSHLLLRRRLAQLAVGLSFFLFLTGALAAVRASFPFVEIAPGDQDIGPVVDRAWFAYLFAFGTVGSVLLNSIALILMVADFRGPGLVSALSSQASNEAVRNWLDFIDPPSPEFFPPLFQELEKIRNPGMTASEIEKRRKKREEENDKLRQRLEFLRESQQQGRLSDPLEPLFEIATRSIESRRYAMVGRTLGAIEILIDERLGAREPPDAHRFHRVVLQHLGDLLEVAIHSGSYSQIAVLIRTLEGMGMNSLQREDYNLTPHLICEELMLYAKRIEAPQFRHLVTDIVNSMVRVTDGSLRKEDFETFERCLLQLARVAEIIAPRYEPEVGVQILAHNLGTRREQTPEDALQQGMEQLVRAFTRSEHQIPYNLVLTVDALEIPARAFLSASRFDEKAAIYAANYVGLLGQLGRTAARTLDGDSLRTVVWRLRDLCEAPHFFSLEPPGNTLASQTFEIGIIAEMNFGKLNFERLPEKDETVQMDIAKVVARCSNEAIQEAVTNLYLRGHTSWVPEEAQRTFKQRVDRLTTHTFRARDGRN